jgi:hypothetical protein
LFHAGPDAPSSGIGVFLAANGRVQIARTYSLVLCGFGCGAISAFPKDKRRVNRAMSGCLLLTHFCRRKGRLKTWLLAAAAVATFSEGRADAQTYTYVDQPFLPTASNYGGVGLLDMRNARFMPDGYLSLTGVVKSPDDRIALTFQALPWLEATIRYTIDYALPPPDQRALYSREFDLKARLFQETEYTPQVAVGLQDIIGTGQYSAEYLVASKYVGPFDLTAGLGWGALAQRDTFENPFCAAYSGFCRRPPFNGEGGTLTLDYFRGGQTGLFGGIEYQTPIPKLTFKIEYSTYAYREESAVQHTDYERIPVNVGLSYRFWSNVDVGVEYMGGRELAVSLSMALDPTKPNFPARIDEPPPFTARTEADAIAAQTEIDIASGGPVPTAQTRAGVRQKPPPITTPTVISGDNPPDVPPPAVQPGDEPWRVHFVDLTAPNPTPDSRPPDPAMSSAASADQNIGHLLQDGGFHVTDNWVNGRTLVVQIDNRPRRDSNSICEALSGQARSLSGVREIAFVGADWNPIKFCDATSPRVQAQPVSASVESFVTVSKPDLIRKMREAIAAQKLIVEGISINGNVLDVEVENERYLRDAEAISRTLRALSAIAPADITAIRVTTSIDQIPLTTVTISRTEIDALGNSTATPAEVWSSAVLADASPSIDLGHGDGFPRFDWSIFPSLQKELFDPNNPIYVGLGLSGSTHTELLPGLAFDADATYSVWNNFGSITRTSNSVLPHVRSDAALYLKYGATGIDDVTLTYYSKFAPDVYARASAGYIETMFGGAGGEVLYRPFGSRWAVGVDMWQVWQRNFNDLFGFQHYNVATGHVSLYWETPWYNITTVVRGGRYLAGDYGGTFEVYRRFDTGILIGGWFTLTNVPFSKFGEGSFDKGIRVVIPLEWVLPFGSASKENLDLQPVERDGGQRLINDTTLFDMTQSSSEGDLQRQWPSVFK